MLPSRILQAGHEGEVVFRVGLMARGKVGFRVGVEDLSGRKRVRGKVSESAGESGGGVWFSEVLEVRVE